MTNGQVLVKSGEIFVGLNGESIYTTLGSCVAFCAYDRELKVGGMVHYLLPSQSYANRQTEAGKNLLNFGDVAIPKLLAEMKNLGCTRKSLEISIFGGCGETVGAGLLAKGFDHSKPIGRLNYDCAREWVKRFSLFVAREKTRLSGGLRVKFDTAQGEFMIALNRSDSNSEAPDPAQVDEARLILIGASTGGTEALKTVVRSLPANTPPILIVQHMPPEFTKAFSETLNTIGKIHVKEVRSAELLQRGCAYLAPGGKHIRLRMTKERELLVTVSDDPPVNLFKPSVDYLFNSVAALPDVAKLTRAALLTGMGDDGARGLLALRRTGALTIAQDEGTSMIFGMPKAAIERNAATHVCRIEDVAAVLMSSQKKTRNAG